MRKRSNALSAARPPRADGTTDALPSPPLSATPTEHVRARPNRTPLECQDRTGPRGAAALRKACAAPPPHTIGDDFRKDNADYELRRTCGQPVGTRTESSPDDRDVSMSSPGCYLPSMGEPVELHVGGKTYRVVASAEEASLQRLAGIVDERLRDIAGPGNALAPQSLLLVAISLAHDLEEERQRRAHVEARSRETLRSVLARIDQALETADGLEGQSGTEAASEEQHPAPDS